MKAKSKILFPVLTICAAICTTALIFFAVNVEGNTTNCPDGYYLDSTSNVCVEDSSMAATGTDCGTGCYLDTATNNCVCDDTGTTCGTNEYWDSTTNTCVYNGTSESTDNSCGSNTCASGDYCADSTNGWCCPDGTVICPDGSCMNSASECTATEVTCGTNEYWDSTTNSCVYCSSDHYWDSNTNTCVYDDNTETTCGSDQYWDSTTNSCVYNGTSESTDNSCGSNTCASGDYCADSTNGWCCPDGTVICPDGSCMNSASECTATNDCSDGYYWDSHTNSCVADGSAVTNCATGCYWDTALNYCVCDNTGTTCGTNEYWDNKLNSCVSNDSTTNKTCGTNEYWDPMTSTCVYDDSIKIDCGTDSYWDPATNSCIYKDKYCEPDYYWNDKYGTCKPISSGDDTLYAITKKDVTQGPQGPGGCQSKEECDAYCKDPNNTKECIEFAVNSGLMDPEETKIVRLMIKNNIIQGPGGCRSKEECDAYCDDPANTKECVEFAVKVGFMTSEEAERIIKGGPGGCQSKEECDAYCDDPANTKECISFAIENDISKENLKIVSPNEIKTVLEKVTEPAKCETELECKIYCSSVDANKELCQAFASMVIVEDKVRSITEFVDDTEVKRALFQSVGPGGTKNVENIHAYCSNPLHDKECQEFVSAKKLLDKQILDDKKEELKKKRLEKERMFTERVGARVYKDTDNDGISDYDELNIFYTNPNMADTDGDGILDGTELLLGKDPLSGSPEDQPTATRTDPVNMEDKIIYEDPKIAGEEKSELFVIEEINVLETEMFNDGKEKAKKISFQGTAPANSFVTLYIYSTPIIITVKTDEDGNWNYVLDKELEDGKHEIHVAITDNAGKIFAKSKPLPFVKEAAAVTIDDLALLGGDDTDPDIFDGRYLYVTVLFIIIIIGWVLVFTGSRHVKVEEPINK